MYFSLVLFPSILLIHKQRHVEIQNIIRLILVNLKGNSIQILQVLSFIQQIALILIKSFNEIQYNINQICNSIKTQMHFNTYENMINLNMFYIFPLNNQNLLNNPFFYQSYLPEQNITNMPCRINDITNKQNKGKATEQKTVSTIEQNLLNTQKYNKLTCKKEKYQQDDDYLPYKNNSKSQKVKRQDDRRNIVPNLIHQIFSYITKQQKSCFLVKKILQQKFQNVGTVDNYYLFQKILKKKMNRYVNIRTFINNIMPVQQSKQFIIFKDQGKIYFDITRRLIKYYLDKQAVCAITCSRQIKFQNKTHYFRVRKQLLEQLNNIYININIK